MRLIDADALMEAMRKFEKEAENVMTCPSWWSAYKVIKEQPTAFDVEKVAEELSSNSRFVEDINENNIKCISCVIGQKTAIDIVRKGGAV